MLGEAGTYRANGGRQADAISTLGPVAQVLCGRNKVDKEGILDAPDEGVNLSLPGSTHSGRAVR